MPSATAKLGQLLPPNMMEEQRVTVFDADMGMGKTYFIKSFLVTHSHYTYLVCP